MYNVEKVVRYKCSHCSHLYETPEEAEKCIQQEENWIIKIKDAQYIKLKNNKGEVYLVAKVINQRTDPRLVLVVERHLMSDKLDLIKRSVDNIIAIDSKDLYRCEEATKQEYDDFLEIPNKEKFNLVADEIYSNLR